MFLYTFSYTLANIKLIYTISETDKREENQENEGAQKEDLELPLFNMTTIASATDNFSDDKKLGEGGFGPVYRVNHKLSTCFSITARSNKE